MPYIRTLANQSINTRSMKIAQAWPTLSAYFNHKMTSGKIAEIIREVVAIRS